MSEFKVGCKVMCIDDSVSNRQLSAGSIYEITQSNGREFTVDGQSQPWSWKRFEIVEEPAIAGKLKVGDRVHVVKPNIFLEDKSVHRVTHVIEDVFELVDGLNVQGVMVADVIGLIPASVFERAPADNAGQNETSTINPLYGSW